MIATRIGIVARLDRPGALEMVRKVSGLLKDQEVVLESGLAKRLGERRGSTQTLRKCDAIITVGGDGTVLFAQQLGAEVPILGINLGGRGFLADIDPSEVRRALRMLLDGQLKVEERDRLASFVGGKRLPDALNDVVVFTANIGKIVSLKVWIDGKVAIEEVHGDGVIVATTTGSTAYARAAGGPLMDPRINGVVVAPICPSNPKHCPIVVPASSRVEVGLTRPGRDALIIVDGNPAARLRYGGKVETRPSDKPARFFKWGEFYSKTREKLQ